MSKQDFLRNLFNILPGRPGIWLGWEKQRENIGKLVTLIAGKRRPLLFAGDGRRSVYDKKAQRYAKDNGTEFNCRQW